MHSLNEDNFKGIFNLEKKYDNSNGSLFLEGEPGLLDTINKRHPGIWKLYKQMKTLDWDENEFDYSSCLAEFKTSSKADYEIMIATLAWQWEADSVASNSLCSITAPFVSSSELWCLWTEVQKNECLTDDHDVLTTNGWKKINEITLEDKIAQWNYNTRIVTFINPLEIITKPYKGVMYEFTSEANDVSQLVTDEHRMPIVYPYWLNENQVPFKYAKDVNYHGGNGIPVSGDILTPSVPMTAQEKLYIAVQADGTLCSEMYNGNYTGLKHYRFSFSKKRKIERLFKLCKEANWEIKQINTTRDDVKTFDIYMPVSEYNDQAKTFDWIKYDTVGHAWINEFLDELQYWDGNTHSITKNIRYISTNKECVDKVVTLAHLVGKRAHIAYINERKNVLMPSGHYSDTKPIYQVYITNRDYLPGNSIIKTEIQKDCLVYCLRVPDSYFLVRRNGIISVTGNCVHSLTYSEIVRGSFEDPQAVLKQILNETESFKRLQNVTKVMSEVKQTSLQLSSGIITRESIQARDAIMKFVITLLILERIQFMSSFAITFAYGEVGRFLPAAKAVQKIANDEWNIHVQSDKEIITNERSLKLGRESLNRIMPEMTQVFNDVVASELDWTENKLFKDNRHLVGCTSELVKDWVLFGANDVASFLGMDNQFKKVAKNPIPYMEDWININGTQSSPQEEKVGNYLLGGFVNSSEEKILAIDDL